MAHARKGSPLAVLLVLAGLSVFCFAGVHELAASAQAQGGVLGNFVGQLKREDDEAERRELREHAPQTREDRQEAREQAEQAEMEVAVAREREQSPETLAAAAVQPGG
jgi:multidrug resistance efflux pump